MSISPLICTSSDMWADNAYAISWWILLYAYDGPFLRLHTRVGGCTGRLVSACVTRVADTGRRHGFSKEVGILKMDFPEGDYIASKRGLNLQNAT